MKPDKTKTELAKDRQTVTNFVVNTKVNLLRERRSAIKKEVCDGKRFLAKSYRHPPLAKCIGFVPSTPETGDRLVKRALGR